MKKTKLIMILSMGSVLLLSSCSGKKDGATAEANGVPAIDLSAMDTTVKPQDDFYRYCNGNWMKNNPLPSDKSRFGSFDVLRDSSEARIHRIIEELASAKNLKPGTDESRIATLYNEAMDSVKLNKDGAAPIMSELKEIEGVSTKADLIKLLAKFDSEGSQTFFSTYVFADDKNSTINIMHLNQGGVGMGDRDYYLKPENKKIREAYINYLTEISKLAGFDDAQAKTMVDNTMKVETAIANMQYSSVELRDTHKNYNMLNVADFVASHKGFDWATYLQDRGLKMEKWDVGQTGYFDKFDKWFASASLEELKDYMIVSTISGAAPYLSDNFYKANFDFYSKELAGVQAMRPRWKRAVSSVEGAIGEALGKVYVDRYFSANDKARMEQLIENLRQALSERINSLTWMSPETKQKAQEKLSSFKVKVGYPNKWKDYSKMDIKGDSYYADMKRANKFEYDFNMSELGKPVDMDRWYMYPQTVNAYYQPTTNEICFPAGILQPPFYNSNADDPVNYGAIGVVIGHEMTHGFDDQGRNYDKDGNMINWWTDEDAEKFNKATRVLVDQFNKIEVAPGVHANGENTLGENIADQGGLLVAHLAMQKALEGKKVEKIDGFTPDQRFYIAYARVWGQNMSPAEVKRLTIIDVHSLGEYRVNQTLRNIDDWYKAFNVKEGDKMYIAPEERIVIW